MNESIFFIHLLVILFSLLIFFKMGKEPLILFIILQAIFANLFIAKQMQFFGLTITCSDLYAVGTILGLNLLQEFYGKEMAKKCVTISFFSLILFLIFSKIHLAYEPSLNDTSHKSFSIIFNNTFRIISASLIVFFLSQRFDIFFYGFLKKRFSNFFISRIIYSAILSQLMDTILFSVLGLYKIVENIFNIILISFLVKTVAILTSSFFILFAKKFFTPMRNDV